MLRATAHALLAAASIVAATGLFATGARAATVDTVSYGGRQPVAMFESVDGCLRRSAFVFASEGIRREGRAGRTEQPSAFVSLAQTDMCTGVENITFGHADLDPGDLAIRGDLSVASLHGTVLVRQPFQDTPPAQVTFDLKWQATGDALRSTWNGKSEWDGNIDIGRQLLWYRAATASGTISSGGIDYTGATPSVSAAIWFSRVGDIEISR